jgi:hypothetical protein
MSGLLYNIQEYFKASYSGRYIAYVLAELFKLSPQKFAGMARHFGLNYTYQRDHQAIANSWHFPGKSQLRFADLAVVDSGLKPLVLIEIKDADIGNKTNEAQLGDYLDYIKRHRNVEFVFLSRSLLPEGYQKRLRAVGKRSCVYQKLFSDMNRPLQGADPFASLLREYLEDIEVLYHHRRPDSRTSQYVTECILGVGGRRVGDKSVAEFFRVVFDNLVPLGLWIRAANIDYFKRGFKRKLLVSPQHDIDGLVKSKGKRLERLIKSQYVSCSGGDVYFYSSSYMDRGGTRVYVEFGYWFQLQRSENRWLSMSGLYVYFQWKPWKPHNSVEPWCTLAEFPNEEDAQRTLRRLFRRAKTRAIKEQGVPKAG